MYFHDLAVMQISSNIAFSLALSCKISLSFFSTINIHAQVEHLQEVYEMNDEPISDCPVLQGKVAFPTQKKRKKKAPLHKTKE